MDFPSAQETHWVLITGASSGIGETFAKRFSQEGWNVILVARSRDQLQTLAQILAREHQMETLVIPADLTGRLAPRQIYEAVREKGIALFGLVNNAGCGVRGKFVEAPLDRYLGMIDLNVRALVELTHLFLPEMIARKKGFVLNVSSTASFQPLPYSSIYAATKSFVNFFTEALWVETKGTGVRILNLCPGVTKTEFGVRAGLRDFRLDPLAEEPEAVVETAFRALKGNAPTVISGFGNRLLAMAVRFFPHRLMLGLAGVVQKIRKLVG